MSLAFNFLFKKSPYFVLDAISRNYNGIAEMYKDKQLDIMLKLYNVLALSVSF